MSLETEVAALTAVNNKLVDTINGKIAGINAAVAAAVAAAPEMHRNFFVDTVAGSDTDGLGSAASPFKTIQKAINSTPLGGRCDVTLLKDTTVAGHILLAGRKLALRGEVGAGRKLIINEFLYEGETLMRMGSFWHSDGSTLDISNLTVSFPASSAGDLSAYYCFAFGSGTSGPILNQLRFYNCTLELRGTFRGRLFGPNTSLYALQMSSTVMPSGLAGLILPGVVAGTKSETIPHILTNLSTL
ncbi:hypothetical protein Q1J61_10245 [Pseudomonas putida]|uniref:hypothetical protein n=1 Tax=Pseudomonas putida TaxID=303 RepID=UPI0034D49E3D